MRAIIRIIKRQTTDEEAMAIKKAVQDALKKYTELEITLETMG